MTMGNIYGVIGAALAVVLACIGSAIGVSRTGQAGSGLLSKDPSKFVNVMILQAIPSSQGLYGFVVAFMAITKIGIIGTPNMLTDGEGLAMLMLCLPIGVVGLVSAIMQGNVAVSAINLIGKQEGQFIKGVIMTAMVELFALFAFIISILGVSTLEVTKVAEVAMALI